MFCQRHVHTWLLVCQIQHSNLFGRGEKTERVPWFVLWMDLASANFLSLMSFGMISYPPAESFLLSTLFLFHWTDVLLKSPVLICKATGLWVSVGCCYQVICVGVTCGTYTQSVCLPLWCGIMSVLEGKNEGSINQYKVKSNLLSLLVPILSSNGDPWNATVIVSLPREFISRGISLFIAMSWGWFFTSCYAFSGALKCRMSLIIWSFLFQSQKCYVLSYFL